MPIIWTEDLEKRLMDLKDLEKKSYKEISLELETTISSVKHKYIRLKQASNDDYYHHPIEKSEQIKKYLTNFNLKILETNAGRGNLTKIYQHYGDVVCLDIDQKKIDYLTSLKLEKIHPVKCDSFKEIYKYILQGSKFDVIDLDPYGFPSRFFPHIFHLIQDGFLFVTFPKMGVQQINKIMKEHYRVFWGMDLDDKRKQEEIIHKKIKDYAFQSFRGVELLESLDLGRMFRFVYRVKKESALNLVGLKVKGVND